MIRLLSRLFSRKRPTIAEARPGDAAAIAAFSRETNADDWVETRADIARLLRSYDDAAVTQEFLRLFWPGGDAAACQAGARQWLKRIKEFLRR